MVCRRGVAYAVSLAALVSSAVAVPAIAQSPAPPPSTAERTVTANGAASVKPEPSDRRSNASIREAVAEARDAGVGRAMDRVRDRARRLAEEAGLPLGVVIAVSDFAFEDFESHGVFGPGQYCGKIRRPIIRRQNGRRRVVGHRMRRICRVPQQVTTRVEMTFSATAASTS